MKNIGVIFAGGAGKRMHSKDRPKQFLELFHRPIIIYTLEHFEKCEEIDHVVIACIEEWIPYLKDLIYRYRIEKVKKIVPGGETGQLSIYQGLLAAKETAEGEDAVVLIHDGVRPLITPELLSRNIACVKEKGSAVTSGLVTETIVVVDEENRIEQVPTRDKSRVAKAPQSFFLKDVLKLHERALDEGITNFIDTCTMMQYYDFPLTMVDGPSENIKITTPEDFYIMRAILEERENAQMYGE
ncbi:MAG: 2-C-methyl-D-erythritol 4-phosphate cytidylyltransferase [Lachnospiraceae bacterium]|nr:2-C-methyl-D-erythritol 4-phosphate cytidylyltransferase [Lachnospiraceae bacterium]